MVFDGINTSLYRHIAVSIHMTKCFSVRCNIRIGGVFLPDSEASPDALSCAVIRY